jgi:hypothetical protein
MNWISEYPTQPGFYWIRNYRYSHPTGSVFIPGATVVEVEAEDFCFIGDDRVFYPRDILSAEWFGPIWPPPETITSSQMNAELDELLAQVYQPQQQPVCSRCGRYNCQENEK